MLRVETLSSFEILLLESRFSRECIVSYEVVDGCHNSRRVILAHILIILAPFQAAMTETDENAGLVREFLQHAEVQYLHIMTKPDQG